MKDRIIIGLTARVVLFGTEGKKEVIARVDTGATKSSIDEKTRAQSLGPSTKKTA